MPPSLFLLSWVWGRSPINRGWGRWPSQPWRPFFLTSPFWLVLPGWSFLAAPSWGWTLLPHQSFLAGPSWGWALLPHQSFLAAPSWGLSLLPHQSYLAGPSWGWALLPTWSFCPEGRRMEPPYCLSCCIAGSGPPWTEWQTAVKALPFLILRNISKQLYCKAANPSPIFWINYCHAIMFMAFCPSNFEVALQRRCKV